jgi:shikimate kinase
VLNEILDTPKDEVLEKIKKLFETRKPFYEKADFTIETENVPVGRTVDFIANLINRQRQKN